MANNGHASSDPYSAFATNPTSKFTPFSISLRNGATLTGLSYIPSKGVLVNSKHNPLLVGIHGATCSAHNWDVSPACTASTYSDLVGIPFVAFHRPNFLRSSGWLIDRSVDAPSPEEGGKSRFAPAEDRGFFREEAHWYHELIFPALWETFGVPNGCSSLVTTSHSMSVPITIIAAGLYARQQRPAEHGYPWAGMVITGFGDEQTMTVQKASAAMATVQHNPEDIPFGTDPALHIGPFPKNEKIALMLGPEGCCDPELYELCWRQNTPFFLGEVIDMSGVWVQSREAHKAAVNIPVLYGMGELEWIWKSDRTHVDTFTKGFVNAPRVEGATIDGAPHAVEWSRVGPAWWLRVFGWAGEVAVSKAMEEMNLPLYT